MKLFKVGDKTVGRVSFLLMDTNTVVKHLRNIWFIACVFAGTVSLAAQQSKPVPEAGTKAPSDASTKSSGPTSRKDEGDYVIEKRNDGSTIKYKKKTSYDFEGANIEGLYNKPSGSYISNIKDVKGKSIIRVRENFDAEVIDSARSIK